MSTTKKLRVAVLGPKGQCGSCVVDELLSRGHSVVGLSRNLPRELQTSGDYKAESIDFNSINELSAALSRGYDAIVCAYGPPLGNLRAIYYECVETHARIKSALLRSNHRGSFIVIGFSWILRPGYQAIYGGIYNEDMAVAIADEVENNKLAYNHWSCVGPIGLGKW
ncbi:hypothetical protein COL922a_003382 [Colletotrichum nupharicola]|nr:hypothetical protein COL922a_003382 [Colletotrichum nupharicola]